MDDSEDQVDPEIQADIDLRNSSARARPGLSLSDFAAKLKATAVPVIHSHVPCRGRCGSVVAWTQEAEDTFQMFNRQLASSMDAPLDKTKIAFCDKCRKYGANLAADRNRKAANATADLIRELRGGTKAPEPPGPAPTPEKERDIIEKLRALGHPDIEGLTRTIRDARESKSAKSSRRGSM